MIIVWEEADNYCTNILSSVTGSGHVKYMATPFFSMHLHALKGSSCILHLVTPCNTTDSVILYMYRLSFYTRQNNDQVHKRMGI